MRTCRSRASLVPSNVTTSAPPESTAQSASVSPSVPTPWNPKIALLGVQPATEITGHIPPDRPGRVRDVRGVGQFFGEPGGGGIEPVKSARRAPSRRRPRRPRRTTLPASSAETSKTVAREPCSAPQNVNDPTTTGGFAVGRRRRRRPPPPPPSPGAVAPSPPPSPDRSSSSSAPTPHPAIARRCERRLIPAASRHHPRLPAPCAAPAGARRRTRRKAGPAERLRQPARGGSTPGGAAQWRQEAGTRSGAGERLRSQSGDAAGRSRDLPARRAVPVAGPEPPFGRGRGRGGRGATVLAARRGPAHRRGRPPVCRAGGRSGSSPAGPTPSRRRRSGPRRAPTGSSICFWRRPPEASRSSPTRAVHEGVRLDLGLGPDGARGPTAARRVARASIGAIPSTPRRSSRTAARPDRARPASARCSRRLAAAPRSQRRASRSASRAPRCSGASRRSVSSGSHTWRACRPTRIPSRRSSRRRSSSSTRVSSTRRQSCSAASSRSDPSDRRVRDLLREAEREHVAALYRELSPVAIPVLLAGHASLDGPRGAPARRDRSRGRGPAQRGVGRRERRARRARCGRSRR